MPHVTFGHIEGWAGGESEEGPRRRGVVTKVNAAAATLRPGLVILVCNDYLVTVNRFNKAWVSRNLGMPCYDNLMGLLHCYMMGWVTPRLLL